MQPLLYQLVYLWHNRYTETQFFIDDSILTTQITVPFMIPLKGNLPHNLDIEMNQTVKEN